MRCMELEPYFERIGYTGPRVPTLEVLAALHLRHPLAIPFENLEVALGGEPSLAIDAIVDKLVVRARGGYCFEHNLLFAEVLRTLGFSLRLLSARVQWNLPEGKVNNRTHTLLRVMVDDEPYFADVGFGGLTMTGPLHDTLQDPQATPHERFRLVSLADLGETQVQAEVQQVFLPLYRFDLQPQLPIDYEMANHWIATSPRSLFTQNLIAARVTESHRYTLRNNQLAIHHRDGRTERSTVTDPSELGRLLAGPFGIRLPEGPQVDDLLARTAALPAG